MLAAAAAQVLLALSAAAAAAAADCELLAPLAAAAAVAVALLLLLSLAALPFAAAGLGFAGPAVGRAAAAVGDDELLDGPGSPERPVVDPAAAPGEVLWAEATAEALGRLRESFWAEDPGLESESLPAAASGRTSRLAAAKLLLIASASAPGA